VTSFPAATCVVSWLCPILCLPATAMPRIPG